MERSTNAAGVRATDGALLDRFASNGDQEAFSELVRRHGGMVIRICRRLNGGDAHAADDAAQQVFLTLASSAAALRTRVSLAGWLYRTSWHVAARHRRSETVRADHERQAASNARGAATDDVPFAVITSELTAALDRALGTLPEDYRNALVLHHLAGYTVEETAHHMDVKVGTAASWLSRGRVMLRGQLEAWGHAVPIGMLSAWLQAQEAAAKEARAAAAAAAPPGGGADVAAPGFLCGGSGSGLAAVGVPVSASCGASAAAAAVAPVAGFAFLGFSPAAAVAATVLACGTAVAAGHAVVTEFRQASGQSDSRPAGAAEKPSPPRARVEHARSDSWGSSSNRSATTVVPEPSTGVILIAAGGLALLRRPSRRTSPGG